MLHSLLPRVKLNLRNVERDAPYLNYAASLASLIDVSTEPSGKGGGGMSKDGACPEMLGSGTVGFLGNLAGEYHA
jgi:hypothetical protein